MCIQPDGQISNMKSNRIFHSMAFTDYEIFIRTLIFIGIVFRFLFVFENNESKIRITYWHWFDNGNIGDNMK